MIPLRYALVADGPSDRALLPILAWTLRQRRPPLTFAQPDVVVRGGKALDATIDETIAAYGVDLLFVHRDAERVDREIRRREIPANDRVVAVIPVRMTEAWLLTDEKALRKAAGNPNGRAALSLPPVNRLESLPDPKSTLRDLLVVASKAIGRRRKRFDQHGARQRLADLIEDFSPLRQLSAFTAFEAELEEGLGRIGVS